MAVYCDNCFFMAMIAITMTAEEFENSLSEHDSNSASTARQNPWYSPTQANTNPLLDIGEERNNDWLHRWV